MIRDDFAGPGGWDVALATLGRTDVVGVEFDANACATARAAGHRREHADVRTMRRVRRYRGGLEGYIASPPCQTFSAAGKGAGRAALAHLLKAVHLVAEGATPEDAVAAFADSALDERSVLVLEPLLVVRDHRPLWVALEQVGPVLPVWEEYATVLRGWGYSVATGLLNAEQYGVPQTRRRAVLLAHRERDVALPTPTHSRYHPRDPQRLDEGVLPWVCMADTLGDTRDGEVLRSNYGTGGDPAARGQRAADQPAPTVTSKVNRNLWIGGQVWMDANDNPDRTRPRPVSEPARTVKCSRPGNLNWRDGSGPGVRVSVTEAGQLQTFPADYPWQGNPTSQYQQVGNAIPPALAAACLRALGVGEGA